MAERNSASGAHGSDRDTSIERTSLILVKGDQRWRFCWEPGGEGAIISHVAELARRPEAAFDWFDAAAVCTCVVQPQHPCSSTRTNPYPTG